MKSFVGLILALALLELASAVTKEYHEKAVAAKDKCAKEHNIEESAIQEFIKKKKLPETEDGKCMLACYLEEMKVIVDGKVDVEEWKATNKHKWDEASIVGMADGVAEKCASSESPDGKNKCDFALALVKCALETGMSMGIPPPDMDNIKRR